MTENYSYNNSYAVFFNYYVYNGTLHIILIIV